MYHRVYERPPVNDFMQRTSALSGDEKKILWRREKMCRWWSDGFHVPVTLSYRFDHYQNYVICDVLNVNWGIMSNLNDESGSDSVVIPTYAIEW